MFRALLVSDLHLTDRPGDSYRWDLFAQLRDLSNEHGVTDLFVLGDLTEFKDYHSSRLVNRLVDSFYFLRKTSRVIEVHILKGNHDGLDPAYPYFSFMRRIPWAHFYAEPTWLEFGTDSVLMLPHTRQPETDWKDLQLGEASHILLHGTVTGAVSESGQTLPGIPLDMFRGLRECTILAGDIHVPQVVGKTVEYVGAPYPIRFGDEFEPRALLVQGHTLTSLPLHNIRKVTITVNALSLGDAFDTLREGDQVKVLIELTDSELGEFQQIKREVTEQVSIAKAVLSKVQLVHKQSAKPKLRGHSIAGLRRTPETEVREFCKRNALSEELEHVGLELLKENA